MPESDLEVSEGKLAYSQAAIGREEIISKSETKSERNLVWKRDEWHLICNISPGLVSTLGSMRP